MIRHLRTKPNEEHAAYLELAAHCYEATALARRIATQDLLQPWCAHWARWVRLMGDSTLHGHGDRVRDVAIGKLDERPVVVSGSDDGTARVWDLATGVAVGQPFTRHRGSVRAVRVWNLGERPVAISGGDDNTIWVWDLATGTPINGPLIGHDHVVRSISIGSVDEQMLVVSGSFDNTVRVWDLATGEPVGTPLRGHFDGVVAVAAATQPTWHPMIVSAASDGTVCIWDMISETLIRTLSSEVRIPVVAIAVTQLDQRPVVLISCGSSGTGTIQAYDLATGEPVGRLINSGGRPARTLAVDHSDDRPILVTGHDDGEIQIWDLTSGTRIGPPIIGHAGFVYALTTGEIDNVPVVVSGGADNTIRIWDLAREEAVPGSFSAHLREIRALASGELDGRPIVVTGGEDQGVCVWDSRTGELIHELATRHDSQVRAVAVGHTGKSPVVISGDQKGKIFVRNARTGAFVTPPLDHGTPIRAVALTTVGGRATVVSGAADDSIRTWDMSSAKQCADPVVGFLYPLLVVGVGRSTGKPVTIREDGKPPLWGPSYYRRSTRTGYDDPILFATIDGQTMIVTGDEHGSLNYWTIAQSKRKWYPRPDVRLIRSEPGESPITALAHWPGRPIVVARGHTIAFGEQRIELDAAITAVTFTSPDDIVVATKLGLACLHLTQRPTGTWPGDRRSS